jgi:hypothetical protein
MRTTNTTGTNARQPRCAGGDQKATEQGKHQRRPTEHEYRSCPRRGAVGAWQKNFEHRLQRHREYIRHPLRGSERAYAGQCVEPRQDGFVRFSLDAQGGA